MSSAAMDLMQRQKSWVAKSNYCLQVSVVFRRYQWDRWTISVVSRFVVVLVPGRMCALFVVQVVGVTCGQDVLCGRVVR